MRRLLLLSALICSAVLAQTSTAAAGATTSRSPERELLERVAVPLWGPTPQRTTVLVGQPPAGLGFTLPQGSRVVGSVATETNEPDLPSGVTVYFDTRQTPTQVAAHFARVLPGAGWKVFPAPGGRQFSDGGFQPSVAETERAYYRQTPGERLHLQTRVLGGVTRVTLLKQRDRNVMQQVRFNGVIPFALLPKLQPPAGSVVSPMGGGSSGGSVTQEASLQSPLPRKALFDHYAAQLKKAGWTLLNRAETVKLTTSLWVFQEEGRERVGLLVLGETGTRSYRATLGVQGLR